MEPNRPLSILPLSVALADTPSQQTSSFQRLSDYRRSISASEGVLPADSATTSETTALSNNVASAAPTAASESHRSKSVWTPEEIDTIISWIEANPSKIRGATKHAAIFSA